MAGGKPGVPNVTIPVIAPPGGTGTGGGPVNLGGLFPSTLNGNGFTDPAEAEKAFARLALASPAVLAQVQAQMYYGGFYSSQFVPTPGLLHPEDLEAFRSAVKTLATITDPSTGKPAGNMRDYLSNLAQVGQTLGSQAARARQVQTIQHPNPSAVRAAVDQAYVNVLGRKASDAEKAAFLHTFDAEVVRFQTGPEVAQPDTTDPFAALKVPDPQSVGGPIIGTSRLIDEAQQALNDQKGQPASAGAEPIAGQYITKGTMPDVSPGAVPISGPLITSGTMPDSESPGSQPHDLAQVDTFLNAIMTGESHGDPNAKNPHASASGLFGYTDGTWNHFAGYLHARDAPPEVQWAKARADVANKLAAYKGDWRSVAMSWYLPAAVGNPALANSVPAKSAGNTLTPNQYADLVLRRMASIGGDQSAQPTGPAPMVGLSPIPSGADALSPLRINVTTPDLGAEAVERARKEHPVESGAHDVASVFDQFLSLVGGH